MPGLFGGGGDQTNGAPINVPITAKAPAWAANMHPTVQPAGEPGYSTMMGNQLAQGGFGTPANLTKWMNSFYKPAPSAYFTATPPKAAPKVAPKVSPVAPSGMVLVDGKMKRIDQTSLGRNSR